MAYKFLIPFLLNHSEFVLPFAASNGIVSASVYALGEVVLGLEVMMGLTSANFVGFVGGFLTSPNILAALQKFPIVGPVIGISTALIAPLLWPKMF